MAAVRERYWVPKLCSLVKSAQSKFYGCKRFNATPARNPIPGQLLEDQTTVGAAFEVIGTDFAVPVKYKWKEKSRKRLSGYLHLQPFKGYTLRVNGQPGDGQLYHMSW